MAHRDVVRIVPVDPTTGRDLDEGFFAELTSEDGAVRVTQAAPTLERLHERIAAGEPAPEDVPRRPDPVTEVVRDLLGAVQAGWRRAQEPGASARDVIGEVYAALVDPPSARRHEDGEQR